MDTLISETLPEKKLQIRRGNKADLPVLMEGEIVYCLDTHELVIGNSDGTNTCFINSDSISEALIYTNESDASIRTVKDALDKLLYFNPSISLTGLGNQEKGKQLSNVFLRWTYNKSVVSQKINGVIIEPAVREYLIESLDMNSSIKRWTIEGNDGTNACTATTSVSFLSGRYWGTSNSNTYDSHFVQSLVKELSTTRAKSFTVNAARDDDHIFYCIPASFGEAKFSVGGFEGGFTKVTTIQYTNAYHYTETYDIYKSTQGGLGTTTVTVS